MNTQIKTQRTIVLELTEDEAQTLQRLAYFNLVVPEVVHPTDPGARNRLAKFMHDLSAALLGGLK